MSERSLKRYTSRPFPPYRHEPGKTPHPERHPQGHMYGRELVAEEDDFLYAVDLFNAGYFWEAHVYWERLWAESTGERAAFLRGLIQLAAALVKAREGSTAGRDKLIGRALEKLRRLPGPIFEGVYLPKLIEAAEAGESLVIELRS